MDYKHKKTKGFRIRFIGDNGDCILTDLPTGLEHVYCDEETDIIKEKICCIVDGRNVISPEALAEYCYSRNMLLDQGTYYQVCARLLYVMRVAKFAREQKCSFEEAEEELKLIGTMEHFCNARDMEYDLEFLKAYGKYLPVDGLLVHVFDPDAPTLAQRIADRKG